jgi:predicted DNA-binding transcriptional regulator AlpA
MATPRADRRDSADGGVGTVRRTSMAGQAAAPMPRPSAIVRPEEVSERTTVPLETLKYWRKLGRGPRWYKLGGRVVYDDAEVERWISEQRELTGAGGSDGARRA